jgi:hypothetical protein
MPSWPLAVSMLTLISLRVSSETTALIRASLNAATNAVWSKEEDFTSSALMPLKWMEADISYLV